MLDTFKRVTHELCLFNIRFRPFVSKVIMKDEYLLYVKELTVFAKFYLGVGEQKCWKYSVEDEGLYILEPKKGHCTLEYGERGNGTDRRGGISYETFSFLTVWTTVKIVFNRDSW